MLIKNTLADGRVIEIAEPENADKLKVEHERLEKHESRKACRHTDESIEKKPIDTTQIVDCNLMQLTKESEKEPLSEIAIRFTRWLEVLVKRAKLNYIRQQKKYQAEISISEAVISDTYTCGLIEMSIGNKKEFDFENDQMEFAFSRLTPARSQILTLLFVQNLTPQEIAVEMHCSVQHVYNQRSLALKDLKLILSKGNV